MRRLKLSISLALAVIALALAPKALMAQLGQERPLLVEGKKTIYQRVITNPGAFWHSGLGGQAMSEIIPFTVLYVYEHSTDASGVKWLRCSANSVGEGQGWLKAEQATEFKQALVLLFAERANRRPLLFFKTFDDLMAVASSPDIPGELARLEKQFEQLSKSKTAPPPDFPLVSVEPADSQGAVDSKKFYLMPIFTYDDATFEGVKLLEVGSIDPGGAGPTALNRRAPGGPLTMAPAAGD
jgi:serine/threonine-protein kinase PpkA